MKAPKANQKSKINEPDPFFGLKLIAYYRTGLPVNEDDLDEEAMVQFAKWQICKIKNVLFHDPIWDNYTTPEILAEFFSIKFDENEDLRKKFEAQLVTIKKADEDWILRMAAKHAKEQAEKQGKIKEESSKKPKESSTVEFKPAPVEEFEDKF
jgi:hypothetical protein